MKPTVRIAYPVSSRSITVTTAKRSAGSRWRSAFLVSVISGTLTWTFGNVIGIADWCGLFAERRAISILGPALLLVTFPLAIFAAHCLDKSKQAERAARELNSRQNGMRDDRQRGDDPETRNL